VGLGSEVLLEQLRLNFSFRNKFTILLPCGRLVDDNTLKKSAFLKVLLAKLITVVMKTKIRIFNDNEIKGNEELMLLLIKMMDGLCLTPI
jgi:hypothetical protein